MESNTETSVTDDVYELVTNRIIELMEQGTVPWQKPWLEAGFPRNLVTKRPYRGMNVWLLQSLNYEQNLFLTWEQLKAIGGSVNRGEKSHLVIFWKPTGQYSYGNEKHAQFALRYYRVFNVAQCNSIPATLYDPPVQHDFDPITECEYILEHMPAPPSIVHKKQKAFYDMESDAINLPGKNTFKSIESYYSTLFHELVHSTGHPGRLNRESLTERSQFGSELYSLEELIAELGTTYLCSQGKILTAEIENSAAYIDGWLNFLKNDTQCIVTASTYAQKAVDYILNTK